MTYDVLFKTPRQKNAAARFRAFVSSFWLAVMVVEGTDASSDTGSYLAQSPELATIMFNNAFVLIGRASLNGKYVRRRIATRI
jgi:hypothetical protein